VAAPLSLPAERQVPIRGQRIHVREWPGEKRPFLLVHGLASNCMTWEATARRLHEAGHRVVSIDQRGHGLSSKPDTGYSFADVTDDLRDLIGHLQMRSPIVAGQSWGGNVVLEYAARFPFGPAGVVLVDGGFIDLQSGGNGSWEQIAERLKPPALAGTPRAVMLQRMRQYHADWSDEGIEHQMANFETLPDGTVRSWLTLDRHMQILRSLWEQRPHELYPRVQAPTLVLPAENGPDERWARKRDEVAAAEGGMPNARVRWFEKTDHDIHVQRPAELADVLLDAVYDGFFPA